MASKKKYYAVAAGRKPGIYHSWPQTLEQVHHYSGAVYKSFSTLSDAESWLGALLAGTRGASHCCIGIPALLRANKDFRETLWYPYEGHKTLKR